MLFLREVSGILKASGAGKLSYQQFGAFLGFMHQDSRFYPLDDGRIVLTDIFTGNTSEVIEIPSISNVAAAINEALPYLMTDPHGVFTEGVLLGTMKSLGSYVRSDQLAEVFEQLRLSPHVRALDDGRYKLIKDNLEMDLGSSREQLSLEAMIKALRGGPQRKPYSRRQNSWKRNVKM